MCGRIACCFRTHLHLVDVHSMRGTGLDVNLNRWTASFCTDDMVEMVIKGNVIERYWVAAGMSQGSLLSSIIFASHMSGFEKSVHGRVSRVEGLSFMDNVGRVPKGSDVS